MTDVAEWPVVGFDKDPVDGGDLDKVAESRRRYAAISEALEGAVSRLGKIVSQGSDGLAGEYVEALREDAEKVREPLAKAALRYADAAREVATYEPELDHALTETRAGLADGKAAAAALSTAEGLPDGEPDDDGALTPEESAKDTLKRDQVTTASGDLDAAKRRVRTAFDRLQVAGRRLGDAVNCKNYDDGLSDSTWDKVVAVLKKISKVLAIIGMVLAILCFIFPGVALLLIAAAVVAVAGLVVAGILYAKGAEGLPDLIFAIVGVLLLGGGVVASIIGRNIQIAARAANQAKVIKMLPMGRNSLGPGGQVVPRITAAPRLQSDFYDNPLTRWVMQWRGAGQLVPELGLWRSSIEQMQAGFKMWGQLRTAPGAFFKEWTGVVGGWGAYRSIATLQTVTGTQASHLWWVWGVGNSVFTIVTGLIWTGGRTEWRGPEDQVIPDFGVLGGGDE